MSSLENLDYVDCLEAMRRCKLTFSPSEAHAIAAGLLAGSPADREAQWAAAMYADLDPNDALARECKDRLDALYAATAEQMRDVEFGLQLFLPPQDVVDYGPATALRDWAQGFLYGFGLSGDEHIATLLSPEGQEALHDFYEIGNMEVPEQPAGEEEQQALAEIEEYLRVAVMLINEDMHAPKPTGEVSHEIH